MSFKDVAESLELTSVGEKSQVERNKLRRTSMFRDLGAGAVASVGLGNF